MYSIAAVSHITQIIFNLSHVHSFVIIRDFCAAFLTVKVTRSWKKLHNVELQNVYSSPNMGSKYNTDGRDKKVIKQFWSYLRDRNHVEGLDIDRQRILKSILKKRGTVNQVHLAQDVDNW
jgi:hypothetical protein